MNEEISFKREKKMYFRIEINSINGKSFSAIRSRERILAFPVFFKVSFSAKNPARFISFPLYICLLPPHFHPFASFFPSTTFSCRTVALNYPTIHHFPYTKCKTLTYGTPVTYWPSSIDRYKIRRSKEEILSIPDSIIVTRSVARKYGQYSVNK